MRWTVERANSTRCAIFARLKAPRLGFERTQDIGGADDDLNPGALPILLQYHPSRSEPGSVPTVESKQSFPLSRLLS